MNFKDFIVVVVIWNICSFIMMGFDKFKSKKGWWRIKESTILIVAFALGGIGTMAGSMFYRHKTGKLKFKTLLPLAVIFNLIIMFIIKKYIF